MTKIKHPQSRDQRLKVEQKHRINEAKKERESRVWRKLTKEHVKEKETVDELREYTHH